MYKETKIMKKLFLLLFLLIPIILSWCSSNSPTDNKMQVENSSSAQQTEKIENAESSTASDMNTEHILYIKIGNSVLEAELVENSSTEALLEKLKENDITIQMRNYGNFEKVGELGKSRRTNYLLTKIDREQYDQWRYHYPKYDTTQQWAKVPPQELSDILVETFKDKLKDM